MHKKGTTEKKITPAKQKQLEYEQKRNKVIETFFMFLNKKILEAEKMCSICGKELVTDNYWKNYSYSNIGRMDENGKICCPICKNCSQKLFDYYYKIGNKNLEYAMERVCCDLNIYWDVDRLKEAKQVYEKNNRKLHILSEYIGAIGRVGTDSLGLTYWDSPTIKNRNITLVQGDIQAQNNALLQENKFINEGFDSPIDFAKEDMENRRKILRIFRYDPFEMDRETDKPALYRNLVMMLDDAMEEDFVKLNAALEIVRSFNKIDNYRRQIYEIEISDEPDLNTITALTKLKAQEMKNITELSKDHGFAGRYAQNQAKGAGTLSGVMEQIREKQYEKGILNLYDIQTSESIAQAAEASMKAIFNQLSIATNVNEQFTIIQKQREDLIKLRKENQKLQEDLRKANCKIAEQRLEKEAKERMSFD